MTRTAEAFFAVLQEPRTLATLDTPELDRVLRIARTNGVLARLAVLARRSAMEEQLPEKARQLLASARPVAEHHERSIRFDVGLIRKALAATVERVVLLKGAAYVLAGLPAGAGRLVSDIDILVPKERIAEAERALGEAGWRPMVLDAYDQRYYRTWMHELPPLRHEARQTVLDVHHTILPETARRHPDPAKLLAAAVPLVDGLAVLGPQDMVLHSAAHLFSDGDLAGGIRDLVDLDALIRHFGKMQDGFWDALVPRALEQDLARPLYYALRHCGSFLGTPIPQEVLRAVRVAAPPGPTRILMDALCARALEPRPDPPDAKARAAMWMLYVRSHWMRMPPLLLARHLLIKAVRRRKKS